MGILEIQQIWARHRVAISYFAFAFALSSWTAWIPAYYTVTATFPSFQSLSISEGTLSIDNTNARRGSVMSLIDKKGEKLRFSCQDNIAERPHCIDIQYDRKIALVRWFPLTLRPFVTVRRPAEIVVDGKVVLAYDHAARQSQTSKSSAPWMSMVPLALIFFVWWVWREIERWRRMKRDRLEKAS